jgi:hypothetical protein
MLFNNGLADPKPHTGTGCGSTPRTQSRRRRMLSPELAAGISRVKGVKQLGQRSGNWLSAEQSSETQA